MKITYQDRIIAFVDVLGFSRLVYASDNILIEKYFSYVVEDLKDQLKGTKFDYLLISDSIVISAPNDIDNLKILVKILSKIQAKLLSRGILIRGAISSGNLYTSQERSIVVGPGLVRAYNLESKAIYPRIVLDRMLIRLYYDGAGRMIGDFDNWLTCDDLNKYADGAIYINYVRYLVLHNTFYLNGRMETVAEMFMENYYSNDHFEKYDWLLKNIIHQMRMCLQEDEALSLLTKQRKTRDKKIRQALPLFEGM